MKELDSREGSSKDSYDEGVKVKKKKPGIVYLPSIPPRMDRSKIKAIFEEFGTVNRMYLQVLEEHRKKRYPKQFSEGWVEFESKRVAKQVADLLNNTIVGGKRLSRFYDYTWSIKYLPGFKWAHLTERIIYEKALFKQKIMQEVAQARLETQTFAANIQQNKKFKKDTYVDEDRVNEFKQKELGGEGSSKDADKDKQKDRSEFFKSIFAKS